MNFRGTNASLLWRKARQYWHLLVPMSRYDCQDLDLSLAQGHPLVSLLVPQSFQGPPCYRPGSRWHRVPRDFQSLISIASRFQMSLSLWCHRQELRRGYLYKIFVLCFGMTLVQLCPKSEAVWDVFGWCASDNFRIQHRWSHYVIHWICLPWDASG